MYTSLTWVLCLAAAAGKVSEARLDTLLTHEGVLAPLRAYSQGHEGNRSFMLSTSLLILAGRHFSQRGRSPGGSPEAHAAAQSVVLGAARQGAALLQLKAVEPSQRTRAIRRAARGGFLQVCLFATDHCTLLNPAKSEIPCSLLLCLHC